MSDAVLVKIIEQLPMILAAVFSFISAMAARKNAKSIIQTNAALAETKTAVSDTRQAMETLEKNTNSIKDALVKVTGEAEFAKGLKQGEELQRSTQ